VPISDLPEIPFCPFCPFCLVVQVRIWSLEDVQQKHPQMLDAGGNVGLRWIT